LPRSYALIAVRCRIGHLLPRRREASVSSRGARGAGAEPDRGVILLSRPLGHAPRRRRPTSRDGRARLRRKAAVLAVTAALTRCRSRASLVSQPASSNDARLNAVVRRQAYSAKPRAGRVFRATSTCPVAITITDGSIDRSRAGSARDPDLLRVVRHPSDPFGRASGSPATSRTRPRPGDGLTAYVVSPTPGSRLSWVGIPGLAKPSGPRSSTVGCRWP